MISIRQNVNNISIRLQKFDIENDQEINSFLSLEDLKTYGKIPEIMSTLKLTTQNMNGMRYATTTGVWRNSATVYS